MTEPLSNVRLTQIHQRAQATTPGPWEYDATAGNIYGEDGEYLIAADCEGRAGNGPFIAASRQDVEDLLAEVERLRALLTTAHAHQGYDRALTADEAELMDWLDVAMSVYEATPERG